MEIVLNFFQDNAFGTMTWGNLGMLFVGGFFLFLAITKNYEPLLLVPIGFGIIIGNIPFSAGMGLGIYEEGSIVVWVLV